MLEAERERHEREQVRDLARGFVTDAFLPLLSSREDVTPRDASVLLQGYRAAKGFRIPEEAVVDVIGGQIRNIENSPDNDSPVSNLVRGALLFHESITDRRRIREVINMLKPHPVLLATAIKLMTPEQLEMYIFEKYE